MERRKVSGRVGVHFFAVTRRGASGWRKGLQEGGKKIPRDLGRV